MDNARVTNIEVARFYPHMHVLNFTETINPSIGVEYDIFVFCVLFLCCT